MIIGQVAVSTSQAWLTLVIYRRRAFQEIVCIGAVRKRFHVSSQQATRIAVRKTSTKTTVLPRFCCLDTNERLSGKGNEAPEKNLIDKGEMLDSRWPREVESKPYRAAQVKRKLTIRDPKNKRARTEVHAPEIIHCERDAYCKGLLVEVAVPLESPRITPD